LRAEAAANRVEARNQRERADAAEAARVADAQAAEARVQAANVAAQQATTKIKNKAADAELRAAAVSAGLVDQDLIGLIDRTGIAVDDEGTVTGVTEAIAAFKAKKPTYFTGPTAPPAAPFRTSASGPVPPPNPSVPPPASVRTIPKEDYAKQRAAALAALPK
jgi:hypothetical protein